MVGAASVRFTSDLRMQDILFKTVLQNPSHSSTRGAPLPQTGDLLKDRVATEGRNWHMPSSVATFTNTSEMDVTARTAAGY